MEAHREGWVKGLEEDLIRVETRLAAFDPGRYQTTAVAKAQQVRLENWRRRLVRTIEAVERGLPGASLTLKLNRYRGVEAESGPTVMDNDRGELIEREVNGAWVPARGAIRRWNRP